MHPNITCTFSACKHIGTHSHVVLDLLDPAPVFTPKHALKHVYKKKPRQSILYSKFPAIISICPDSVIDKPPSS